MFNEKMYLILFKIIKIKSMAKYIIVTALFVLPFIFGCKNNKQVQQPAEMATTEQKDTIDLKGEVSNYLHAFNERKKILVPKLSELLMTYGYMAHCLKQPTKLCIWG